MINGTWFFTSFTFKSTLLNLANPYKKIMAKNERNQTITSEGMAIYLPKTPDVLMNKVARSNPKIFLT